MGEIMNREIEFRIKNELTGKWHYGSPLFYDDGSFNFFDKELLSKYGLDAYSYIVFDEDTLGQYTGLKDKNGTKIFEGDVFEDEKDEIRGIVVFENGSFRIKWFGLQTTLYEYGYDDGGFGEVECETFDMYNIDQMEVIGNIYDNPELLQQTE